MFLRETFRRRVPSPVKVDLPVDPGQRGDPPELLVGEILSKQAGHPFRGRRGAERGRFHGEQLSGHLTAGGILYRDLSGGLRGDPLERAHAIERSDQCAPSSPGPRDRGVGTYDCYGTHA